MTHLLLVALYLLCYGTAIIFLTGPGEEEADAEIASEMSQSEEKGATTGTRFWFGSSDGWDRVEQRFNVAQFS